jgi:hypothetical protein
MTLSERISLRQAVPNNKEVVRFQKVYDVFKVSEDMVAASKAAVAWLREDATRTARQACMMFGFDPKGLSNE